MPANQIAVNLGSYGRYRENALRHLQSIGIHCVEIGVPAAAEAQATQDRLAEFGLSVALIELGSGSDGVLWP